MNIIPRAISFTTFGSPAKVLSVSQLPPLQCPTALAPSQAVIKFIQSPINPADINVIQGVYPSKPPKLPEGYFLPGNEGLAQIYQLSPNNSSKLSLGDWVIMRKPQLGTWATHAVVNHADILPLPLVTKSSLSPAHLSTISVNPPTALRMLSDFVDLHPGDYFLQNAATSAVGRAAIQIAHAKGIKSINFIRNRPDLQETISSLKDLGATHVCTYDELEDKQFRFKMSEWTNNATINLALNCVGGPVTSRMASLLGLNAHLVSYGAMSKLPISLPTSLFIFKNLTCHGYWQSRWYQSASDAQIEEQMKYLIDLMRNNLLRAPEHRLVTLKGSDAEVQATIRHIFEQMDEVEKSSEPGFKKVLLCWD